VADHIKFIVNAIWSLQGILTESLLIGRRNIGRLEVGGESVMKLLEQITTYP
jgi:hypothetical protein